VLIRTNCCCSDSKCCRSFMVKMQCDLLDRLFKPVAATLNLCCPYNITWWASSAELTHICFRPIKRVVY
jgi:hypothetical protein